MDEDVRRLEAGAKHDRLLADKARATLRVLRVYELRLSRLTLRAKMRFDDGLQTSPLRASFWRNHQ
jgi:hypothetical protein